MLKIFSRMVRKVFNSYGYEIMKTQHALNHFDVGNWIENLDIKTIIDVGSNEGQFIKSLDKAIPGRRILAFEPIKACYDKLVENTKGLNITTFNCGLSDHNGTSEINISENFVSSSILPMEPLHKNLYPESKYVNKQTIELKRLDDVVSGLSLGKNILLKIDVQGYENIVIAGGSNTINSASVIIIEYSYAPIYEGQWLFDDTYRYITDKGFRFAGVYDQALSKKTGIPVFADAIFIKKELFNRAF
jgi:FkbM family methyltransferase